MHKSFKNSLIKQDTPSKQSAVPQSKELLNIVEPRAQVQQTQRVRVSDKNSDQGIKLIEPSLEKTVTSLNETETVQPTHIQISNLSPATKKECRDKLGLPKDVK